MFAKTPETKPRKLWDPRRRGTFANPYRDMSYRPWLSRKQWLQARREYLWSVA